MRTFTCERVDGGYSGFSFVGWRKSGRGVERIAVNVSLETILELAAAWHTCPSASAGHVVYHRDRNKHAPCEITDGTPAEDVNEIERIKARLGPWQGAPRG